MTRSQNSLAKLLFSDMGNLFQQTAHLMEKKRNVADQLSVLAEQFNGVENRIKEFDENATSAWINCLSKNACIASDIFRAVNQHEINLTNARLDVLDALISASEGMSKTLIEGASSLSADGKFVVHKKDTQENRSKVLEVQKEMMRLAENLYSGSFGLRVYSGLDPDEDQSFKPIQSKCNCTKNHEKHNHTKDCTDHIELESGVEESPHDGEDLMSYIRALETDFEKLKAILALLALYFLWLASQGFATAGGPPCDDECSPTNNVIGTRVTNVRVTPLPGSTIIYQAFCDVEWDFCCTNRCFIFYTENFVKTVTTGPHKLGGNIRLVVGQSARVAQRTANRRAKNVVPIVTYTPPAKPGC